MSGSLQIRRRLALRPDRTLAVRSFFLYTSCMRPSTLVASCCLITLSITWLTSKQNSDWTFVTRSISGNASLYARAPLFFPEIASAHKARSSGTPSELVSLAPAQHTSLVVRSIIFSDMSRGYLISGTMPPEKVGILSLQYGVHVTGLNWKTDYSSYNTELALRDFQNEDYQVRALVGADRFALIVKEKHAQ